MSRRATETKRELLQRFCVVQRALANELQRLLPSLTDRDCDRLGLQLAPVMEQQGRVISKFRPERAPRRARSGRAVQP